MKVTLILNHFYGKQTLSVKEGQPNYIRALVEHCDPHNPAVIQKYPSFTTVHHIQNLFGHGLSQVEVIVLDGPDAVERRILFNSVDDDDHNTICKKLGIPCHG